MLLDVVAIQMLKCIICHPESNIGQCDMVLHQVPMVVPPIAKKNYSIYNPFHGSTSMKKHLVHEHATKLTKYKACIKEDEDGDGGG
jgi:hypothetical protein